MQISLIIFFVLVLIFLFGMLGFSGSRIRSLRTYLHTNYILGLYLAIIYQITISSLANVFYDNRNFDLFSFCSSILSFFFLCIQLIIYFIMILVIAFNKIKLIDPEFENFYGITYENLKLTSPKYYMIVILNFKLQLLLFIAFVFQNYAQIQIISFIIIYSISLISKIVLRPQEDFLNNSQSIIREFFFLCLSISFYIYNYFLYNKNPIVDLIKMILLINLISIFMNETIFSIIQFVVIIKELCTEEKVSNFFMKKNLRLRNLELKEEILFQQKKLLTNNRLKYIGTKRDRPRKCPDIYDDPDNYTTRTFLRPYVNKKNKKKNYFYQILRKLEFRHSLRIQNSNDSNSLNNKYSSNNNFSSINNNSSNNYYSIQQLVNESLNLKEVKKINNDNNSINMKNLTNIKGFENFHYCKPIVEEPEYIYDDKRMIHDSGKIIEEMPISKGGSFKIKNLDYCEYFLNISCILRSKTS